ncbi:MAG: hypothetical protein OIN86_06730 [Candidatus Methanoperedens sp.]|nr:hypothetical protein [Candidatus Methanoperedens sp.]CAG0956193.1 hypothetical protein METP1_00460 [Methanosarcinales archaeon]
MKFKDLLTKYKDDKKRVLINGLGSGETRGLIIEIQEDYIVYELLQIKKEKNSRKEKQNRELKYIPISNIFDLSEGEKETEKTLDLTAFNK